MSKIRLSRRQLLAGLASFAFVSACGTSPPPRRFVMAPRPGATTLPARVRIMIANVGVAKYLDQPQIVRHSSEYEVTLADLERWGEGMGDMVARILAEDLAARLTEAQVFVGDGPATVQADVSLELYVERFDPDPDGTVILATRWTIRRGNGTPGLGSARVSQRPTSSSTGDLIAAMSDALATLADRLAPLLIVARPPDDPNSRKVAP
jgi:uncharacterized lipoprotein YmbA